MEEEIITESAIVAQFLCDSFPSHLLPGTRESPTAALERARMNFFVDTWNTKITSFQLSALRASTSEEQEAVCKDWVAAMEKEIEPLLANAAPFFGGSKELTFAEVMTAPFVLRWRTVVKDSELLPASFAKALKGLPNFSKWADAIESKPSVTKIYDESAILEGMKARVQKMRAASK